MWRGCSGWVIESASLQCPTQFKSPWSLYKKNNLDWDFKHHYFKSFLSQLFDTIKYFFHSSLKYVLITSTFFKCFPPFSVHTLSHFILCFSALSVLWFLWLLLLCFQYFQCFDSNFYHSYVFQILDDKITFSKHNCCLKELGHLNELCILIDKHRCPKELVSNLTPQDLTAYAEMWNM